MADAEQQPQIPSLPVSPVPTAATSQRTVDQLILILGVAMLGAVAAVVIISIVTRKVDPVEKLATLLIGGLMGALTTDAVRRRLPTDPPEMHGLPPAPSDAGGGAALPIVVGAMTFEPDPSIDPAAGASPPIFDVGDPDPPPPPVGAPSAPGVPPPWPPA